MNEYILKLMNITKQTRGENEIQNTTKNGSPYVNPNIMLYGKLIRNRVYEMIYAKICKKIEINKNESNLYNCIAGKSIKENEYNINSIDKNKNMSEINTHIKSNPVSIVVSNAMNNIPSYCANKTNDQKNEKDDSNECMLSNKKNTELGIFIDKKNAINSLISSAFAGVVSRTATAPLDRIKYIMQITNNFPISEIFKIIKKDGMLCGFFRGNCINIVKIVPELSIKMYSYEFLKLNIHNYYTNSNKRDHNDKNMNMPFIIRFLIGSSSGLISAIFIYPLEIVKTRLIVSNKNINDGIIKCFHSIYKHEKTRGFYNGLSMHLYGIMLFSGCNMSIYDYLKYLFFSYYKDYIHKNYCLKNDHEQINENYLYQNTKNENSFQVTNNDNSHHKNYSLEDINGENIKKHSTNMWNHTSYMKNENNINSLPCSYCSYCLKNVNCLYFLIFGMASSFVAQIISYPFLVLRTRMQTLNNEIASNYLNNERKKIKSCSFILYNINKYGFKSIYRGIYVNLLKTIPATSITWLSYEYSMRMLQSN